MKYRRFILRLLSFTFCFIIPFSTGAQSGDFDPSQISDGNLKLFKAVMCEDMQGNIPQNPTSVFSLERRKAVCFTSFDPVPEEITIYHIWFHKDRPSAKLKLTLKPPRWSTFSSIQFREEDIGPWKVEITDSEGHIFHILRFSITE